jgi:hypothetical protein
MFYLQGFFNIALLSGESGIVIEPLFRFLTFLEELK